MSEFSNEPMVPSEGSAMSMTDTWVSAVTKPNVNTFARIAAQPGATTSKALLWVFVASLVTSFATFIAQAINAGGQIGFLRQFLPPELARELPIGATPSIGFGTVICGAPITAIFTVLFFAIWVALIQWVAKLFGGTGSFDKLAYTFSAIIVPFNIISAILTLIGIIPFVGILTGLISFALIFYAIVLEILAVQAVNKLDMVKAIGAVLLPWLAIVLVVCCCVIAGLGLMGPVIGNVFDSINQSLGGF